MEFEKQGYIVIASVSSPEAISDIESKGHGYIRALILDPNEVRFPYATRRDCLTVSC